MKHLWATALVALGSCLIVNAQSGSTDKELIALEQSFNDALSRADWEAVERLCANDLVFTNAEGSVTNTSDQIGSLKSGDVKFESIETSDVKVQDLGNVAVVTGKVVERGRYKTNDLSGTYRFTDVWAKRNSRWQLVAGQETREKSASTISVEQEITQLEKQFSEAEVHKDIQRMSKLVADDLTDVEDDGSIWTKSDIIKLFESPTTVLNRDTISELQIRQYGHIAIVTLLDSTDFTVNGRDMGGQFRLTDVWARRDGAWQLVAFHSSKIKKVSEASKGSIAEASSNATSRQEGKKQPHSSLGMKSESSDSVKLKQLEQDWLDSYREGDADKMGKILADDFIGRWADGSTQTKGEQLRVIRTGAEKHSTNQMLECNVRLYGDTAVVTGIQTEQSILEGRDGSGTYSYTDVFVKRDGRWQVVASETKRVASQTGSRESVRDRVIGTWQLMSAGTLRRDGSFEPYPEYGPNAKGYLMYDSTGHMCVSLANPNHPRWVSAEKPTDAEKVRSYDVFFAYCGTYEIREKEGRIVHRPEIGSWPHYIGTDQNRNFRLEGDRLILSDEETPPNGEYRRYQITWQRVSPTSYAAQEKQTAAEDELIQLELAWAKAEETYDPKVLEEILAKEYVSMNGSGEIQNKAQEIAADREPPAEHEVVDDISVRIYGDTAVVLGRFTWTDRDSESAKIQGRFVDTVIRRDGKWKVVANSYVTTTTSFKSEKYSGIMRKPHLQTAGGSPQHIPAVPTCDANIRIVEKMFDVV